MQSISLVPSTAYNNSIYIAEKKNCEGGVIVLEDRITEYYMDVQSTTAVSVDMRLLHQLPNSALKFTLIVYSTGNNVLNLSGFNVEQIQVWNGKSVFTVMKGVGDANWNIQMTSSDVRPEQWLRCVTRPTTPNFGIGIFNYIKLYSNTYGLGDIFSKYAPGQTAPDGYFGEFSRNGDEGNICAKFPMPVWLKSVCIGVTTNTAKNLNYFPNSLQVYGTNDGVAWTQILNTSLTPQYGSVDTYMCTTTNYYTMFKFKFIFGSNASSFFFPSISLSGFYSELINTGAYSLATPYCPSLPFYGYNVESNSSDMSSTSGNISYLTGFSATGGGYHYYTMTRSDSTPWEYIFTFPEAIRTVGFIYMRRAGTNIRLFSLSYSDDKENWTEYCKVDGSLDNWVSSTTDKIEHSYFYDSASEHKYYKITIYSNIGTENYQEFYGLAFIQFQKGHYFTFESFVPKLSSNTQAGYMLIASNSSEGDAYKLFDQSITSYGGGQITDGEWSLMISLPEATVVRGLEMVAPPSDWNRMPYAFSIQGSQDNDTWTNIKSFLLSSNYWSSALQIGQWDVENETAYKYYRLIVTNTAQGSYVRIGELGLSSYASFKGVNWYEDEYVVPVMSANSQDGYVASASSTSVYADLQPYKAFDRSTSGKFEFEANVTSGWIQIQLPEAKIANIFQIGARNDGDYKDTPRNYSLDASNDSETWDTLFSIENSDNWSAGQIRTYTLENSTAYTYYRLNISNPQATRGICGISILNLINRIHHESN